MESPEQNQPHSQSESQPSQNQQQIPDFFVFLRDDPPRSPSFFSENGFSQDIIQVTQAEPDVCLEVFYALYHVLWPQIERQCDISFEDAWTAFIGGSALKGSLCPPEKLIAERRVREIKNAFSKQAGEARVFQYLDQVIMAISNLKQKIESYPVQILHKEDIITSLDLVSQFYLRFRNKVTSLIRAILDREQRNLASASESDKLESLLEPKAVMMGDIFSPHWAYRIPRDKAEKILSLNTHGRNLQSNLKDPSNHRVRGLPEDSPEPLVFFKANGNPPIQPEKEFMLYNLYQHLQIPVPETALLILTDVFEANPEYFYAVQASEAVLGESPLQADQEQESIFDHEAYVFQAIGALLTNPSDGSFKNFKYSPKYQTLISIDNDLVFKPELTPENIVNVKSVLYLLPQIDKAIPKSIKTLFTTIDPHLTVFSWLQHLSQRNKEYNVLFAKLAFQKSRCIYQNLFPQSEVPSLATCLQEKIFVDPLLQNNGFFPQILVSKDLLSGLVEKLQKIEEILRPNSPVTVQGLFEEISPVLGKYYRKLRLEFPEPEVALQALWGVQKNGIDYSALSSLLNPQEINRPISNHSSTNEASPERFSKEYRNLLVNSKDNTPLDLFIKRQRQRKRENALNLKESLKELKLLVREELTDSKSVQDIIDFCNIISKMVEMNKSLIKEITSLLFNLPHPELKWRLILEQYFLRPDKIIPEDLMLSSQSVIGALIKQRTFLLSGSEHLYLFDEHGNIKRNPLLTGRSPVTCFPVQDPEFYLKQYPEWPGYEFASILFMRLLGVEYLPYQDLIIIKDYPVLLSQKIPGSLVQSIWSDPEAFHKLDPFHTGLLILSAMLINPEDGKEDNFILTEDKRYLVPIDSDHCFLPSFFQKEGSFWNAFTVNTALQTKTLLFCLDEMYMSIPLKVKQHLLSIDFDTLLPQWMAELDKLENRFNNITDQDQKTRFLEKGTIMRIPFYKQFIQNLHWKAHKIQDLLRITPNPTPFDLLKAVEPFAAKCYENSFKQGSDLQTRFRAATDQLYTKTAKDGSRVSILNTQTMMEIVDISEEELQKDAAYQKMGPLDALEYLNQLVEERSERIQKEQEMLCELDENSQEKKWMSLFGESLVETGLKAFFANPQEALILKGSKFVTNNKLTELFTQTPDKGMRIRFLSLPESPLLADKEIKILAENCPNLEYLNISGCIKLKQFLTTELEWPLLSRLEAKDCLSLEKLISHSPLKILRIGTDSKIEIVTAKPTLDIFLVSNKAKSFELSLKKEKDFELKSSNQIISHEDFVQSVLFKKEKIEELFSNANIRIGKHAISSGEGLQVSITALNLPEANLTVEILQRMAQLKFANLKSLDLSLNKITEPESLQCLSQADWPRLTHFDFSGNQIADPEIKILAQGNFPSLQTLNLSNTKISKKGLLHFLLRLNLSILKEVDCNPSEKNFAESLLPKNWPFLEKLDFSSCQLAEKDVTFIVEKFNNKLPKLKHLNLSDNAKINDNVFKILVYANWPLIEILNLTHTEVTEKGSFKFLFNPNWPNFKQIAFASQRQFKKSWPELRQLDIRSLQITRIEIAGIGKTSNWPQLQLLNLSNNGIFDEGLSFLVLANWPFLQELLLKNTRITAQGIEILVNKMKLPALKKLDISENAIFNKGLHLLVSGFWPLFQHLIYRDTKVTTEGNIAFLANFRWKNLHQIEHSLAESFYNYNEELGEWSQSKIIRASIPMYEGSFFGFAEPLVALALDMYWLDSKEIYLSIFDNGFTEKLILLPRNKWDRIEAIRLTLRTDQNVRLPHSFVWPSNLTVLTASYSLIAHGSNIEKLLTYKCIFLEELYLSHLLLQAKGIRILVTKSDWPNLKKLDLSKNDIQNEGLGILTAGKWPKLEYLNLNETNLILSHIESSMFKMAWPNLTEIHLKGNRHDKKTYLKLASRENRPQLK